MAKRDSLFVDASAGAPSYVGYEAREVFESIQSGAFQSGDFKVTAGAGLTLDSAAGVAAITGSQAGWGRWQGRYIVADDATENSATWERLGGGTGIPANAATNPRLDAVVLKQYDTSVDGSGRRDWVRMYVPGVATAGAALGGALPGLPNNSVLIAEVLVPANSPTTIPAANIRDRRPWARGAYFRRLRTSADYTTASTSQANIDGVNLAPRVELSGVPCRVTLRAVTFSSAGAVWFYLLDNGVMIDNFTDGMKRLNVTSELTVIAWDFVPSAGSHVIVPQWVVGSGTATAKAGATSPLELLIEEIPRQNTDNS